MVAVKPEIKPTISASDSVAEIDQVPLWYAIAYTPKAQVNQLNQVELLDPSRKVFQPVHPLTLFLPPVAVPQSVGTLPSIDSIFLRIGANLDIDGRKWAIASELPRVRKLVAEGILKAYASTTTSGSVDEDEVPQPGYLHFTVKDAIQLVRLTSHQDWLDDWMKGEIRSEIIKESFEQKARLEKLLADRTKS